MFERSIAYLSLSSHISTLNKNYRYLEEFMKITYEPFYKYKPLLAYFNKLHREAYRKKAYMKG